MSKNPRTKSMGFSLVETMIVLTIVAVVAVSSVAWLQAERERAARAAMVSEQAVEMATIARAVEAYLTRSGLPPIPFVITRDDLVSAGLLPPEYASRDFGGNLRFASPTLREYWIGAGPVAGGYRAVIYTRHSVSQFISAGKLERIGLVNDADGWRDFSSLVARRASQQQLATTGVVLPGMLQSDLVYSGFAVDLSSYMTHVDAATPVVLVGFKELATRPDIKVAVDPDSLKDALTGGYSFDGKTCRLATGSCDSGETEAWQHTVCDGWHDSLPADGTKQFAVSLGSQSISIKQVSVLDNTVPQFFTSLSPLIGEDATGSKASVHSTHPTYAKIAMTGLPSGHRTDGYVSAPHFAGQNTSTTALYRAVKSSNAAFTPMATLDSCGASTEIPSRVYRLDAGTMNMWTGLMPSSIVQDWLPNSQFISATDPATVGPSVAPYWGERIETAGGDVSVYICRARRIVTSGSFVFPAAYAVPDLRNAVNASSVSFTTSCPSASSMIRIDLNAVTTQSKYPARVHEYVMPAAQRPVMRYCCK